jgi:hypothetical protein
MWLGMRHAAGARCGAVVQGVLELLLALLGRAEVQSSNLMANAPHPRRVTSDFPGKNLVRLNDKSNNGTYYIMRSHLMTHVTVDGRKLSRVPARHTQQGWS